MLAISSIVNKMNEYASTKQLKPYETVKDEINEPTSVTNQLNE
jgi:hypothetical protein